MAQGRLAAHSEMAENAKIISKWNLALRAGLQRIPLKLTLSQGH